jgi:hypothetical protein
MTHDFVEDAETRAALDRYNRECRANDTFLASFMMLSVLYSSFKVESTSTATTTLCHLYDIHYKDDEHANDFHRKFTECVSRVPEVPLVHLRDRLHEQLTLKPDVCEELFAYNKLPKEQHTRGPHDEVQPISRPTQRNAKHPARNQEDGIRRW